MLPTPNRHHYDVGVGVSDLGPFDVHTFSGPTKDRRFASIAVPVVSAGSVYLTGEWGPAFPPVIGIVAPRRYHRYCDRCESAVLCRARERTADSHLSQYRWYRRAPSILQRTGGQQFHLVQLD